MSEEWISAGAAQALGPAGSDFCHAIVERARVGLVKARAKMLLWNKSGHHLEEHDCEIPKEFWRNGVVTANWGQGDFGVLWNPSPHQWMVGESESDMTDSQVYGVTFVRADIEAMLPVDGAVGASATSKAVRRNAIAGRPPIADWEAVMIEMGRALYLGDLKPKTQADIEKAIAEYLSDKGGEPAESTIREHARKMWQAIQS